MIFTQETEHLFIAGSNNNEKIIWHILYVAIYVFVADSHKSDAFSNSNTYSVISKYKLSVRCVKIPASPSIRNIQ